MNNFFSDSGTIAMQTTTQEEPTPADIARYDSDNSLYGTSNNPPQNIDTPPNQVWGQMNGQMQSSQDENVYEETGNIARYDSDNSLYGVR